MRLGRVLINRARSGNRLTNVRLAPRKRRNNFVAGVRADAYGRCVARQIDDAESALRLNRATSRREAVRKVDC